MTNSSQEQRRGLGIRARLMLIFITIFTVALIIFAVALSFPLLAQSVEIQQASLDNEVFSVTSSLAREIFGEDVREIVESGDINDPATDFVVEPLSVARNVAPNAGWAYTVAPDPDNPDQIVFVTVVRLDEGGGFTLMEDLFLTPYQPIGQSGSTDTSMLEDAFNGDLVIASATYTSEGSEWLTGFAPIRDDSGQIVALVGTDVRSAGNAELITRTLQVVGLSFVLVYPLLLVTIFLAASSITRPVHDISDAAEALEDENKEYDTKMLKKVVKRGDELGQLSRVFDRMAIEVQAREQRLKEQLTQLKIEIDTSKQEQQVSEIVGTDYFQDLQARSLQLRQKRQTDTDLKVVDPDDEETSSEE